MATDHDAAPKPVWRMPLLLALITCSGLISALMADGWGDVWSWCALGGPLVLAVMCLRRKT